MKPLSRTVPGRLGALVFVVAAVFLAAASPPDPLATELSYWLEQLRTNPSTEAIWLDIKPGSQEILTRAEEDLRKGRRFLALERLARARTNLKAATYLLEHSEKARDDRAVFEVEWRRLGDALAKPSLEAAANLRPAAVRALAEASVPQVHEYYQASLEYGRNTEPASGLFYLGAAQAQRELPAFCRQLAAPSSLTKLAPRALDAELEALENDLLAAYRPPAAIDRHGEFITASATLKEAKELNAAGLYHGALLTYLRAIERFSLLRGGPSPASSELAPALARLEAELAANETDQSLGTLLLETAAADLESSTPELPPRRAAAIVRDVMPKYFAALGPAPPRPPLLAPQTRITLVRWPYT